MKTFKMKVGILLSFNVATLPRAVTKVAPLLTLQ